MKHIKQKSWLTIPQAAALLQCHHRTMRRRINNGGLRDGAVWEEPILGGHRKRIDPDVVLALIRERSPRAGRRARRRRLR